MSTIASDPLGHLCADPMAHVAFFGDGRYALRLGLAQIEELERIAETGIGAVFQRVIARQFHYRDITATIRLALIGGGTSPEQAARLVSTYGESRPLTELLPLALDILTCLMAGPAALAPADAASQAEPQA